MITRRKILQVLSSIPLFGLTKLVKGNTQKELITDIMIFDKTLSPSEIKAISKIYFISLENRPTEYYPGCFHADFQTNGQTFTIPMFKMKYSKFKQYFPLQYIGKSNIYYYINGNESFYGILKQKYLEPKIYV